jgi:hypothetical protein
MIIQAITSTTRAAANPRQPSPFSSMRFATVGLGRLRTGGRAKYEVSSKARPLTIHSKDFVRRAGMTGLGHGLKIPRAGNTAASPQTADVLARSPHPPPMPIASVLSASAQGQRSNSRTPTTHSSAAGWLLAVWDARPAVERHRKVEHRNELIDPLWSVTRAYIASGKRTINPSRFGIFTFGSVCAFIVSFSPISLFSAKM